MRTIEENLQILNEIYNKYNTSEITFLEHIKNCNNVIMSRSRRVSTYGMFLPCPELQEIFRYSGTITKNKEKAHFIHYFDDSGKIIGTIRQYAKGHESYFFYYYYDTYIDIVEFFNRDKKKQKVGRMYLENGEAIIWLTSDDIFPRSTKVNDFYEYFFKQDDGLVLERMFYFDFEPPHKPIERLRKYLEYES